MSWRPMRKLSWAVLGVVGACGGESVVVENIQAREIINRDEWPVVSLSLEGVGAAPLAPVRLSGARGGAEQVSWETRFETRAKRGVVSSDPMVVSQRRTFDVRPSGASPTTFDFELSAASDEGSGGPPVDAEVARSLVGRRGSWRADERCAVVDAGIATDGGAADRHLPALLRTAVELCPLLPEEAVGVGARWTTQQTRADGSTETSKWLLTQRVGERVVLTFSTSIEGSPADTMAEGRLELDSGRAVPVRYDARGRSTRTVEERKASGSTTQVAWTTTWTMHAEASPLTGG